MRVPILKGLLLASAWTACAQNGQSVSRSEPSNAIFNSIDTVPTTTSSPTVPTTPAAPTDTVFEFVAFQIGEQRIYDLSRDPTIHINMLLSDYENIKLYIRKDDRDTIADTITGVANGSASMNDFISVVNPGEDVQVIKLEINNIVTSGSGGHVFFLVLQANADSGRTGMGGEGLEDVEFSPLFAVTKDRIDPSIFQDEDLTSSKPAEIEDGSPSAGSGTGGNDVLSPTATAATSSSSKGKKSGGLATGAIAGIAVGAAVVLIVVVAAIWFILRRRRNQQAHSHHADAATPLAAGYGGAAAAAGSRDFIGEKEAGAIIAESPESQAYTDQPDPRHSTLSGAAIIGGATAAPANASYTESGHQAYDEAVPAGHSPTDQQPPHHGSASGIRGVDSPVPTASVARHLVDEDMTADEIARLEEEERELDRQIQEAGRRRQ